MRIDAKNLLDRLGKNDFAYKEFEDRFNELELWPIFEALLHDPRLQAMDRAERASPVPVEKHGAVETVPAQSLSAFFGRYGEEASSNISEASPPRRSAQPQDVRAMLRHLSDLGARGEI